MLASHPEEVRSFYEDTVAPIVKYDDQYATDLVGTLEAYLEQNCNMNATAAAIYAHRHTVAYRLDRVKELTASTRCSPRTASGSGSGSRRTGSSRRGCRGRAARAARRQRGYGGQPRLPCLRGRVTRRPGFSHCTRAAAGVPVVDQSTTPRPVSSTASRTRPGFSASLSVWWTRRRA